MSDAVLVLNSGSSSIKYGLFELSASEPILLCKGLLDEHEARPRLVAKSPAGETLFEKQQAGSDTDSSHLFADVLTFIEKHFGQHRLRAIGFDDKLSGVGRHKPLPQDQNQWRSTRAYHWGICLPMDWVLPANERPRAVS